MTKIPSNYKEIKPNIFYNSDKKTYYVKTICPTCNKICYVALNNFKKFGKGYCNRKCSHVQNHISFLKRDPKANNIMNLIDTPNFCYLIGLIVSDGHIRYPNCCKSMSNRNIYTVTIELNKTDVKLLKNIKHVFGGKIYKNNKNTYSWIVHNRDFIYFLMEQIGLTHNKSLTLNFNWKWFDNLSIINQNHFLRGIIDGDGCICISKTGRYVSICNYSPQFLNELYKRFLNRNTNCKLAKNNEIKFFGKYAISACQNVFTNDSSFLYMERKYNNYQKLIDHYRKIKI